MAYTTIKTRLALKKDTVANWTSSELVLLSGELAFDESGKYKIGDGTKKWRELPYATAASDVHTAEIDPASSDVGYEVGTLWLNTVSKDLFVLTDKTTVTWEKVVFASDLQTGLDLKVDKVDGKGLSTNDYDAAAVAEVAKIAGKVDKTELGVTVATLVEGKIPAVQLPSYVDDVIEGTGTSQDPTSGFPATGEEGKIYVDVTTGKVFRWSGSTYVEISASLTLGETSSTAFPGDRGKALETRMDALGALAQKDTVATTDIDDGAVTEVKIATDAVTTTKIKDLNVTEAKIAADAVTEAKIATDAVTTLKIKDLNVTGAKIATDAVTTTKIKDLNVTEAKIAEKAVTLGKIADGVLDFANFGQAVGDYIVLECGGAS